MSEEFEPSSKRVRLLSTSETMSSSDQQASSHGTPTHPSSSAGKQNNAGNNTPPAVTHNILNHDNKPSPRDITEFLENPTVFHPSKEFIETTFIEEESALTHSIKVQNKEAVEVLLKCGADPNQNSRRGVAPISVAAHKGNVGIMQLLIDHGAMVNAVNSSTSTALIQAAHFGHLDAVNLLLAHRANADFANQKGTTALMRACQEGHVAISRALINAGVDVNRRNHEGMNALMLASQRGHAEIVLLLIKANASMDEQTAQGSTALMLACKRGHERCVEVLVTMGAEIFIRDRRMRTARDTALRRNHTGLLVWLDTQVQVKKIQELKHRQRAQLLTELRRAYLGGRLQLVPQEMMVYELIDAVRVTSNIGNSKSKKSEQTIRKYEGLLQNFKVSSDKLPLTSKTPDATLRAIEQSVDSKHYKSVVASVPTFPAAAAPANKVTDYDDWHWIAVLYRCITDLPTGVFELVMEMLPSPRIWHWSIDRLAKRCKLAPQQAMLDMSIIIDEILTDSLVLNGKGQSNLLVKLSRSPHLTSYLLDHKGMPTSLLETVNNWADIQSLLMRTNDTEINFKWPLARRMLTATVSFYRWYRMRGSAQKWLGLSSPESGVSTVTQAALQNRMGHTANMRLAGIMDGDEAELMEATDAGGEEASDIEHDIAIAENEVDNEFIPADNDGPVIDSDDDSVAPNNHHQAAQIGFFGHQT